MKKLKESKQLHDSLVQFDALIDSLEGLVGKKDLSHQNIVLQSVLDRVKTAKKVLDRDYIKKYYIPLKQEKIPNAPSKV